MKRYSIHVLLVTVFMACVACPVAADDMGDPNTILWDANAVVEGFVPLYNGRDLSGWTPKGEGQGAWSVAEGTILMQQYSRARGWLQYDLPYKDFVFTCEWKVDKGANSGIFLRVPDVPGTDPTWDAIEIQISDDGNYDIFWIKDDARELSGAIYGIVAPTQPMFRGIGSWNRFVITCVKSHIALEYNGKVVMNIDALDYDQSFSMWNGTRTALSQRPLEGFIGLQVHKGSRVWFRNLAVKDLIPEPAPKEDPGKQTGRR